MAPTEFEKFREQQRKAKKKAQSDAIARRQEAFDVELERLAARDQPKQFRARVSRPHILNLTPEAVRHLRNTPEFRKLKEDMAKAKKKKRKK